RKGVAVRKARFSQLFRRFGPVLLLNLALLPSSGAGAVGADAALASVGAHAAAYRVTDLGTLGGPSSQALGLNDAGQVVGVSDTGAPTGSGVATRHAFIWDASNGMRDVNTLAELRPAQFSIASAVNSSGTVVGVVDEGPFSSQNVPFWWDPRTGFHGLPLSHLASGNAINAAGQLGLTDQIA